MFGGRDNDGTFEHIPKTYNVETINGSLEFTTYDEKPVNACFDYTGKYYSAAERAGCNTTAASSAEINIGIIYNDVWAYKLCPINGTTDTTDPQRYFDGPCEGSGWVLWHPGALQGGCVIELGIEVCNVPSERYNHGVAMFADGAMYVYGGFSQRCADFCDDIWFFDIYLRGWREVYKAGALTYLYEETFSYTIIPYVYRYYEVPTDNTSANHAGPGKRWRHTMVLGEVKNSSGELTQDFVLFGGHRLWQGFSTDNSQYNLWDNYTTIPGAATWMICGSTRSNWTTRPCPDPDTKQTMVNGGLFGRKKSALATLVCPGTADLTYHASLYGLLRALLTDLPTTRSATASGSLAVIRPTFLTFAPMVLALASESPPWPRVGLFLILDILTSRMTCGFSI